MKQPVQPGAAGHTAPEGSSRSRSCWHGVSLWREARKRLRTWVEEVACAPAVSGCVLLDAAAYLTWGVAGELDDMEGVEDAGGVLELVINGVLVSLEGIQRRDLDTGAKLFAALGQPVLMHGARPCRDQVHSSGPWGDPPRVSGLRCR